MLYANFAFCFSFPRPRCSVSFRKFLIHPANPSIIKILGYTPYYGPTSVFEGLRPVCEFSQIAHHYFEAVVLGMRRERHQSFRLSVSVMGTCRHTLSSSANLMWQIREYISCKLVLAWLYRRMVLQGWAWRETWKDGSLLFRWRSVTYSVISARALVESMCIIQRKTVVDIRQINL